MKFRNWKSILVNSVTRADRNHLMSFAAGLSYYFVLSLFPALIALAAVLGFLPVPNLFQSILEFMARFVPSESMGIVKKIVSDVITPYRGTLLSFGLLATLWAASSGFAAMIEALNVAYNVPETRPYWKTRLLAVALTFFVGGMLVVALGAMLLGPRFGEWLSAELHLKSVFVLLWPYLRWAVSVTFVVGAVLGLYILGPNVRQGVKTTLVGAVIAVLSLLLLSELLGIYFQKFANYNHTYGVLGGAIALMTWLYWASLLILMGAGVNSEIIQSMRKGQLPLKQPPPSEVTRKPATEADIAA